MDIETHDEHKGVNQVSLSCVPDVQVTVQASRYAQCVTCLLCMLAG